MILDLLNGLVIMVDYVMAPKSERLSAMINMGGWPDYTRKAEIGSQRPLQGRE